jgi:predicted enzyme related to lactoylglutathione lyase
MALTRISFQAIPVDDQDRALGFYRDVLGLEVQTDAPYEEVWRWIFLRIPGSDSRVTVARRGEISYGDKPVLALVSDDVDVDCAAWEARGVRVASPPADAPWMPGVRWATIRDSEDNLIFVESWNG